MATDGERFTIYLMLRVINADEGKRMPDGGASRRLVGGKSMALLFPFSPKTTPKTIMEDQPMPLRPGSPSEFTAAAHGAKV